MIDSRHITENNVAACGSLLLEMGTLSRLTGLSHCSCICLHPPKLLCNVLCDHVLL